MKIIAFHECDDLFSAKKHEQYYFEEYKATLNSIEPLPRTKPKYIKKMNKKSGVIKKTKTHSCEKCMFNTYNKRDYNRHLSTVKHKLVSSKGVKFCQEQKVFKCDCGKTYKYRQGYYRHKKQCNANTENKDTIVKQNVVENPDNIDYKSMFLDAVTQNKELIELLKEQSKNMQQLILR
jgi:hypothetical protein